MVTRGYPSMSFTHSAAEAIGDRFNARSQFTQIYYFGDHDPSGVDIDRTVVRNIGESISARYNFGSFQTPEQSFRGFASFERVAVTREQIIDMELPTRPTKKSDARSKNFEGESVEVDAIPARVLRQIAEREIEGHVDTHQLAVLEKVEAEERRELEKIASYLKPKSEEGDGA